MSARKFAQFSCSNYCTFSTLVLGFVPTLYLTDYWFSYYTSLVQLLLSYLHFIGPISVFRTHTSLAQLLLFVLTLHGHNYCFSYPHFIGPIATFRVRPSWPDSCVFCPHNLALTTETSLAGRGLYMTLDNKIKSGVNYLRQCSGT